MSKSTGVVLLTGGIAYSNQVFGNGANPLSEIRVLVATGIAALGLAAVEQIPNMSGVASGIAWIALITSLMVGFGGGNSPFENLKKVTGF